MPATVKGLDSFIHIPANAVAMQIRPTTEGGVDPEYSPMGMETYPFLI